MTPRTQARAEQMARMYVADGMTLQEIGDVFGVTRERVRQLVALVEPHAKKAATPAQLGRRAREQAALEEGVADKVLAAYAADGNIVRVAAELHVPIRAVQRIVDRGLTRVERVAVFSVAHRGAIGDDALLDAIREAARDHGGRLTGDQWSAWAARRGLPGKQTVIIRFGRWNLALRAAGIDVPEHGGGGPRQFSQDDCLNAVVRVWRLLAEAPSCGDYIRERAEGEPSVATVRNRLGHGSWLSVLQAAERKVTE